MHCAFRFYAQKPKPPAGHNPKTNFCFCQTRIFGFNRLNVNPWQWGKAFSADTLENRDGVLCAHSPNNKV